MQHAKQGRLFHYLHWLVVVGVVVDFVWRWRKIAYIGLGILWASRLLLLALVISVTVLTPVRVIAANVLPSGYRDPERWYFCYASRSNESGFTITGVPWGDITCEVMLWSSDGSLSFDSQVMVGSILADGIENGGANYHELKTWILPSRGVKTITYHCEGQQQRSRTGTASLIGQPNSHDGLESNQDGTGWSLEADTPGLNQTTNATIDVVGTFRSEGYDSWWNRNFPSTWTGSGTSYGVGFAVVGATSSAFGISSSVFNCTVISFTEWAEWLVGNSPWVPIEDDIVGPPVPTPTPDLTWTLEPWVPITNPVSAPDFEFSGPGETECYLVVPGQSFEWDSVNYGWPGYELCLEPHVLVLNIFGFDIAAYTSVALAYCGLVIIYGLIKSGG